MKEIPTVDKFDRLFYYLRYRVPRKDHFEWLSKDFYIVVQDVTLAGMERQYLIESVSIDHRQAYKQVLKAPQLFKYKGRVYGEKHIPGCKYPYIVCYGEL